MRRGPLRLLSLAPLLGLAACAGPLADRVIAAPNRAWADRLPSQTTVPWTLGGADRVARQLVTVRREPVAGGTISLRVVVIEPGQAPLIDDGGDPERWLRAWTAPARPPLGTLVILHGLWGSVELTVPHAAGLANAGWRCVLLDLRGHGESTGDRLSYGRHEAADVIEILARLRADGTITGPTALVGFSYGASTALMAAARGAPVDAVVGVAPFARLRDVAPYFAHAFAGWLSWFTTEGLVDRVVAEAGRRGGFDPLADSPLAAMPRVRVPTLLIHGDKDDLVPAAQSALLAAAATCPLERRLVPGQDHVNEVFWPDLSLPLMLPWLRRTLITDPDADLPLDGPLAGWSGTDEPGARAWWAWRARPEEHDRPWPKPAGVRRVRMWFTAPAAWLGRDLEIDLGTVARSDETFLGTVRVGGMRELSPAPLPLFRRYRIPAWAVAGVNELTIVVTSTKPEEGIRWPSGVPLLRPADARDR